MSQSLPARSASPVFVLAWFAALCAGGCAGLFPVEAGDSLPHFAEQAPAEGAAAPDFHLQDLQGRTVSLADVTGEHPLVVQLGSYTCPVFRYRRFDMHPLREKYQDRVTFLVVYTQEAHPVGAVSPYRDEEWVPWMNRVAGIRSGQPGTFEQRADQARFARQAMQSNARFLVDGMDNAIWQAYGRAPSAAFVIDQQGRVVLRQPWVEPRELSEVLERLLAD